MNRLAIRSVCKMAAPRLVLVLTKNVRIGLRADSESELREGLAMAGRNYKPDSFCVAPLRCATAGGSKEMFFFQALNGMSKLIPCYVWSP